MLPAIFCALVLYRVEFFKLSHTSINADDYTKKNSFDYANCAPLCYLTLPYGFYVLNFKFIRSLICFSFFFQIDVNMMKCNFMHLCLSNCSCILGNDGC